MQTVPRHKEVLLYLKQLKQLTVAAGVSNIETPRLHNEIQIPKEEIAGIELIAKSNRLISEDETLRGYIFITADGLSYIREHTPVKRLLYGIKTIVSRYITPAWEQNRSALIAFAFLFLLFLVIDPFLKELLSTY